MSINICRIQFIGFNKIGTNILFSLKKRLSQVVTGTGKPIIEKGCDLISRNPYQFLMFSDKLSDDFSSYFRQFSFTGNDRDLLCEEKELFLRQDVENDLEIILKDSLSRLTNFNTEQFNKKTGLNISAYKPTLITVFDIETYKDQSWKKTIDSLIFPSDPVLTNKFFPHALVMAQRSNETKELLDELSKKFYSVYLFDNESELIFKYPDDYIEIGTNFLQIISQMDFSYFQPIFDTSGHGRIFSIGATQLYYPKEEIIIDAVCNILGDPEFGYNNGQGYNFRELYVGKFKEINREEEEEPFTLGDFEPPNTINKNEIPNELIPKIRDSIENATNKLFETLVLWLDDHLERISSNLNKEALSKRIKEITKPSVFLKIYLEKWHDNFDAVEFLLKYDVIQKAKITADNVKNEFINRWYDKIKDTKEELKKNIDGKDNLVFEHSAEVAWQLTHRLLKVIREKYLPQQQKKEFHTKYQPSPASTRTQVEAAIESIPRFISLISRFIILLILLIFFWSDVHYFVLSLTNVEPNSISIWVTGTVFYLLTVCLFYYFSYRRKFIVLYEHLSSFLRSQLEKHASKVEEIEQELIKDFLIQTALHTRENFGTRNGFFYSLFNNNFADANYDKFNIDEFIKEIYGKFEGSFNSTETYYVNRYLAYLYLQKNLTKILEFKNKSTLNVSIPSQLSGLYIAFVSELANNFSHYRKIFFRDLFYLENKYIWQDTSKNNDNGQADVFFQHLFRVVLARTGSLIEQDLLNSPKKRNLKAYLSSINFKMSIKTFNEMTSRSKSTFKLKKDKSSQPILYCGINEYFSEEQKKIYQSIIDQNCIIFMSIEGPQTIENIDWRQ